MYTTICTLIMCGMLSFQVMGSKLPTSDTTDIIASDMADQVARDVPSFTYQSEFQLPNINENEAIQKEESGGRGVFWFSKRGPGQKVKNHGLKDIKVHKLRSNSHKAMRHSHLSGEESRNITENEGRSRENLHQAVGQIVQKPLSDVKSSSKEHHSSSSESSSEESNEHRLNKWYHVQPFYYAFKSSEERFAGYYQPPIAFADRHHHEEQKVPRIPIQGAILNLYVFFSLVGAVFCMCTLFCGARLFKLAGPAGKPGTWCHCTHPASLHGRKTSENGTAPKYLILSESDISIESACYEKILPEQNLPVYSV